MDTLGAIFAGVVAAYLAYVSKLPAGYAGFTLSIVLSFSRSILFWVRIYNLAEIQGIALFASSGIATNYSFSEQV